MRSRKQETKMSEIITTLQNQDPNIKEEEMITNLERFLVLR